MKKVDKVQFALGIFDIVVAVAIAIIAFKEQRYRLAAYTIFPALFGIRFLYISFKK